jgi:hypothetical protein
VTRFQGAFGQYEKDRLSNEEARKLLGIAGRNFRRLCVRYEGAGVEGLRDRRIGKVSPAARGRANLGGAMQGVALAERYRWPKYCKELKFGSGLRTMHSNRIDNPFFWTLAALKLITSEMIGASRFYCSQPEQTTSMAAGFRRAALRRRSSYVQGDNVMGWTVYGARSRGRSMMTAAPALSSSSRPP